MINTNYFNIYNASAGTGKTFSLVRDYLILLFNSNNFELYKNILAITFTNKAVNEMKGRIVRYLINYSNSIDPDEVMIKEITKVSGLTKKEIFSKSSIILKNLLKNYGSFEISTKRLAFFGIIFKSKSFTSQSKKLSPPYAVLTITLPNFFVFNFISN